MRTIFALLVILGLTSTLAQNIIEVESIVFDGVYVGAETVFPVIFKNTFPDVPNFGFTFKGFQSKTPAVGSSFGWKTEVLIVDPTMAEMQLSSYSNFTRLSFNYIAAYSSTFNIFHLSSGLIPAHAANTSVKIPFPQYSQMADRGNQQVFVDLNVAGVRTKTKKGSQNLTEYDVNYHLRAQNQISLEPFMPTIFKDAFNKSLPSSIVTNDSYLSVIDAIGNAEQYTLNLIVQTSYNSYLTSSSQIGVQVTQYQGTTMTNRYSSTNYDYLGETSANQTGLTALNGISGRMKTTFGTTEEVLSMSYDPTVGNVLTSKSTIMMSRRLFAVKCDPSCLTCDGPLPSDCTKSNTKFAILCPAGYTLSNGKCVRIQ